MANYEKNPIIIDEHKYVRNYNVEKAINDFLEYINLKNGGSKDKISEIKKDTYSRNKSDLKKFLHFLNTRHSGVTTTFQINNYIVNEYCKYLYSLKKKDGSEYSPNSRYAYYSSLKAFIEYLATYNAISKDTYKYIREDASFQFSRKSISLERETGYLTPKQVVKIYNNIGEIYKDKMSLLRNQSIYLLLLHGLRRSEIIALKWTDLDFEKSTARITRIKTTKRNTVYISKQTMDKIKEYRETLTAPFKHKDSFIFAGRKAKGKQSAVVPDCHISKSQIRDIVRAISKDETDSVGGDVTTRTFRKTFTVSNMRLNNSLLLIQTYTKHTLVVLEKNYSTNFKCEDLDAENCIENYFNYISNKQYNTNKKMSFEEIIADKKLDEQLRQHYFNEFYSTFKQMNKEG